VALDGEVAAVERVEVVEADRERLPEALCDCLAEDIFRVLGHEQLEGDLRRLRGAEQDPALRRDQLVRPGEVRGVGGDAEGSSQPLTSPRAGQEGRTSPKRCGREGVERASERRTVERPRVFRVGEIGVSVDSRGELLLVAVEYGPVDEQQALLRPRLARRLPEVAREAAADCVQAQTLGQVEIPHDVVVDQRAPGPEDERQVVGACRGPRKLVEQVGKRPLEGSAEDRIVRQVDARGPPLHLDPRCEVLPHVDQAALQPSLGESFGKRGSDELPRKRRGTVDGDQTGSPPEELGRERAVPHLDGPFHNRVARLGVVAHGASRRSSVSAALQEKSRLPSGSPLAGW
jgi:hypothetical protein